MEPADATFARGVHERVLNALHLIMIGQSNAAVITATLQWIDEPRGPGAHSTDACLADVLQDAVQRSGVTGVDIACPQEADSAVSPQAAEALSAAIVEALRNAQRHAQASQVSVRAEWHADGIHVEVRDDGRGFDAQASPRLGLALGITQSMAGVGGSAQIRSDTGHGTVVQLSLGTPSAHPTADFADGHLVREWPRVAAGARRLMADLLASQIDAQSPGICEQARIEDSRIRTWLDSARVDSWMARQVAVAVGHAADHGRRMTAAITGQAGIGEPLDVDLAAALTDAEAITLTVESDHEELLVLGRSDAKLQLHHRPDLSWAIEQVGAGLRSLRISRTR